MVTKQILDTQIAMELPARELLAWGSFNFWSIIAYQNNGNLQISGRANYNSQNNWIGVGNNN